MLRLLSSIKHSPKAAWIRKYTNLLYYNPRFINLEMSKLDTVEVDGCKFHMSNQVDSVQRVKDNPWFENIRSTDVAVDLGANIGAITIPIAKVAKKVYAIEPLFDGLLQQNVLLNKLDNVTIWNIGIGSKEFNQLIKFAGTEKIVIVYPFSYVKKLIGKQIDWLKMDIEGAEWFIEPEEFEGIRELRIEFHIRHGYVKEHKTNLKKWLDWMDRMKYTKVVEHPNYGPDPYDAEDWMVRASLESV